jgi:hypothetical protein
MFQKIKGGGKDISFHYLKRAGMIIIAEYVF